MGGKIVYQRCPGIVRVPDAAYHRNAVCACGTQRGNVLRSHAADRYDWQRVIAGNAPDERRPAIALARRAVLHHMRNDQPMCPAVRGSACVLLRVDTGADPQIRCEANRIRRGDRSRGELNATRA